MARKFHGVSSTNRENRSLEKKIRVLCSRRERTEFTRRPNVKASVINFGRSTKEPAAVSASRFALKRLSRAGDKHIGYKVGQLLAEIQEYHEEGSSWIYRMFELLISDVFFRSGHI